MIKVLNAPRIMKRILFLFFLFIFSGINAQVPGNNLSDTVQTFTNMEQALKNPDKVIKLCLRKKKLSIIPSEIFSFKNLEYLDLSKNKIEEIPSEIRGLKNLQVLILSRNHIKMLPKEIGELKKIKYLNLNQNDLVSLPVELGNMESLEKLDLWSNELEEIPQEIRKLKNLKTLDLRVIIISDAKQKNIQSLLPNTKIYFSNNCKCEQ